MSDKTPRPLPDLAADAHEIRRNVDGSVDEVVGWGFLHIEQMNPGSWWIGFDTADGRLLHLNFGSRGSINLSVTDQGNSDLWDRRMAQSIEVTQAGREAAAGVWDIVAALIASGTPRDGLTFLARKNAEALRYEPPPA